MRSLHIIGSRTSGGAERFYVRLTAALARRGESVVCMLPPNSMLCESLDPALSQRHVKMRSVFDPFARSRITSATKALDVDVVQTYMGRATRLTHVRGRKSRPVHIARLGGYYDVKGYRHAHAWVVNAHGIRDYLIDQGLDAERVFYIGNFVDPVPAADAAAKLALRESLGVPAHALLLVCVGRTHRNKAFDLMLEAFGKLAPTLTNRPVHLLLVGDGPERPSLESQARDAGLTERVRFTGWVSDPERYLQLADLFVCPSRHEPLGNVVLEAWSAGVPVLASETGGLAELIDSGRNGTLFESENVDALIAAIEEQLGADPATRQRYADAGRSDVMAQHSETRVVDAYLDMYRRLSGVR